MSGAATVQAGERIRVVVFQAGQEVAGENLGMAVVREQFGVARRTRIISDDVHMYVGEGGDGRKERVRMRRGQMGIYSVTRMHLRH